MMRYLLNSAVVTSPGVYQYRLISVEEMRRWLGKPYQSYIGYEETAEAISILTNQKPALSRGTVKMQPGDEALVFRLTSRVADPTKKGSVSVETLLQNCEIGLLTRIE